MSYKSELLDLYKCMLRIRRVEEALSDKYDQKLIQSPLYLCIGQEAIAAGVSAWLNKNDFVFSNHRAHGHYLAKGGDLTKMIGELFQSPLGCCKGKAGSMFLVDETVGFMGSTPITGGTVPLAVGAALASSLQRSQKVSVVYFGDGAFEQGLLHEAMNFAKLKNLPVIFVCENNTYSGYIHIHERQPHREINAIAEAHGLDTYSGDGNDVLNVATIAQYAIKKARETSSPQFIELFTHRWREHCGPYFDDDLGYRQGGELEYWLSRCPVKTALQKLLETGTLKAASNERIEKAIQREIDEAFDKAMQTSIEPDAESGSTYVA